MSLEMITLPTNKSVTVVNNNIRTLRQSEKGLILPVTLIDANGSAYDLTNKKIVFSENKEEGKVIIDDGSGEHSGQIQMIDEKAGRFNYVLQADIYSASGEAWFEIVSGTTVVDTTKNFKFKVLKQANIHINNDNYVSTLEALENHFRGVTQKAEQDINALSNDLRNTSNKAKQDAINAINESKNNAVNTLNQLRNQYNDYQKKYNNLQNEWNAQKQKIQQDADNQKAALKKAADDQRNADKAADDKARTDAINAINSAKDSAIKNANDNFSKKLHDLQVDYDAWKVKTIDDFNSKAKQITDSINAQNQNIDAVKKQLTDTQAQMTNLLKQFSGIDFTNFVSESNLSISGTNLLPNTRYLVGWKNWESGIKDDGHGYSIEDVTNHQKDNNSNLIRTKIFHAWGKTLKSAGISLVDSLYLVPGSYTLSFIARANGPISGHQLGLFSDISDKNGGIPLAKTKDYSNQWQEFNFNFTVKEAGNYGGWRIVDWSDTSTPGGSMYYANLMLEAGNIASGWAPNLDTDLSPLAKINSVPNSDIDLNNYKEVGNYDLSFAKNVINAPYSDHVAILRVVPLNNWHGTTNGYQTYTDTNDGAIFVRGWSTTNRWSSWKRLDSYTKEEIDQKIATAGQVKRVQGVSPDPSGNVNLPMQTVTLGYDFINKKPTNGSRAFSNYWMVDQQVLGQIADHIRNLSGVIWKNKVDANTLTDSGSYIVQPNGAPNYPAQNWGVLVVNGSGSRITQTYMADNGNSMYWRIKVDNTWRPWKQLINADTVNLNGPLFHMASAGNNWGDILGFGNNSQALVAFRGNTNKAMNNLLGNYSAGVAFGGADTKGFLEVSYGNHTARIGGGNGNAPTWHEDIAWKSDTNNLQNQLNALRNQTKKTWTGTMAQYNTIGNKDGNTIYYITD
ncbi:BppU family phage baseplate upper protein [Lactobacillus sp. LL6]|uniref:phage upper tail fiber protein n=1 Tax=Lactobacillus sp. LL6 TaxID=2596827 RepID=UPI00118517EB|nr:BppU family phage baseplate upper protein [Lactobacillus sp. LL6]TSO25283.1 DUF2479 domain-containing protein [Lactobacillus sp. LL6]